MPLPINGAAGVATLTGISRELGVYQGVMLPGRIPLYATYWLASSNTLVSIGSGVASADMALLSLDPGAGIRWLTAGTANASIGHPLMAQGSYPEALEVVGSAMLAGLRIAQLGGETTVAKVNIEFYRLGL